MEDGIPSIAQKVQDSKLQFALSESMGTESKDSSRFKKTKAQQRWKWQKKKYKRKKRKRKYMKEKAKS